MSSTKKIWLIVLAISLLIMGGLALVWRTLKVTSILPSTDPVYYDSSYGSTCPVDIKFLESRTSPTVGCECPAGYSLDRTMIGATTGEACYGAGTECPLFEVSCVPVAN